MAMDLASRDWPKVEGALTVERLEGRDRPVIDVSNVNLTPLLLMSYELDYTDDGFGRDAFVGFLETMIEEPNHDDLMDGFDGTLFEHLPQNVSILDDDRVDKALQAIDLLKSLSQLNSDDPGWDMSWYVSPRSLEAFRDAFSD